MSLAMSNKTATQLKDPTYVNISCNDMDDITSALERKLTLAAPAEKTGQVKVFTQERVKAKTEASDGTSSKVENEYVNCVERAPVAGVLSNQFNEEQLQLAQRFQAQRAQQAPLQQPGSKRPTPTEHIYYNLNAQDPLKVMRPAGIDHRRQQMMINNGFVPQSGRVPVENDDRSGLYSNSAAVESFNNSNVYYNLHPHPQQLTQQSQKVPASLHRTNTAAPRQDMPYLRPEEPLPHLADHKMNDVILNNPQYVNFQDVASQHYPQHDVRTGIHRPSVTSAAPQHDYQSAGYSSPGSMHSSSSQISPGQYGGALAMSPHPLSQSGSPASLHGSTGSSMGLSSPHMHQSYSQSLSPQSQTGSQPMFSPSQSSVYSPASVTHAYSASDSTVMGSPGSQSVLSPYSAMSELSSPTEPSLYFNDTTKLSFGTSQHENRLSPAALTADLEEISELEDIRNFQKESEKSPNKPRGGPYYPGDVCAVNNVSTTTQAPHVQSQQSTMPVTITQSAGLQPRPVHTVSTFNAVTRAGITTSAANAPADKIAIQRLPQPAPPPAPPIVLVVVPQTQVQQPLRRLEPKPPTDNSTPRQPAAKSKGRGSKGAKSKAADAKSAGQARPTVPDVKAETISAKAMISLESDEQLLRKGNGDTVLHQAIVMRKQPVILAMLQAIQNRPGLVPLLNMFNDKGQTPLFLAVLTGQTWLTETLVKKMQVDCDLLCRYEVCEGQWEDLSALHYACKFGERCLKEVEAMLASRSATVDAPSRSGMTALHLALWNHGSVDGKTKKAVDSRGVVRALLNAGARCSLADNKTGKTALHFAVENGSLDMTRLILESNCQLELLIDQKNYDHRTALHFAVSLRTISEEQKIELVKYLMSKGASKSSKDKNKLTPRELISPTQTKVLEFFSESSSPAHSYSDDDSYHSVLQSP